MPKLPNPTVKTAGLAGIWSAIGLTLHDYWTTRHPSPRGDEGTIFFFLAAGFFFLVPIFLFVMGINRPFAWNWFSVPEERARYGAVVKRLLVWFVCAGASLVLLSPFAS